MKALEAVLDRIDQDIDQSIARLFALLRIASISTDPAYRDQCRAAAEHVAADLKSIGFDATVRPTAGHPVVVGKSNGAAGPRVLFYGHYDVQPVDPLNLWKTPPFEPRIETLPDGRAWRMRRQRPGDDVHRGLPRIQSRYRKAAIAYHHDDRGRRGMRLQEFVRVRSRQCG